MSALLTQPQALTTHEVAHLVSSSSGSDWLFFADEKIFSYRQNLLITIEPTEDLGKSTILFGAEPIGSVYVSVDNRSLTSEDQVHVRITGDLEVSLFNVQSIQNSQYEDYLAHSFIDRPRRSIPYRRPRPAAVSADFQSR